MIAAPLFLISIAAYVFVEVRMKRQSNRHLNEIYYEFEDEQPALKQYNKWSRLTFAIACVAALLLFLAYVL
jgi:Na+/H+ antiporter NhaC